ncbi:hypothetical protein EOM33_01325 [Candidatus Saccharibacteria bacterium]|nr:hypothetical protein [Candidatus Saccharibacteria bacterium]
MAVKLNWTNPADASKVTIYRALTPIKHNALPAPLAELGPTDVEYSDATAVRNTVYHYVVAVERSDGTVRMTQSQSHGYFPDTGHGPAGLLRGDFNEGYFGTISSAEFFSSATLAAAMKLVSPQVDSYFSWTNNTPIWDKFALDGKILLIPRTAIATTQPRNIYYCGFMYGTDDNGKYPSTSQVAALGLANQKRIVERDGYRYRVRTLRGSTKDTDQLVDISSPETPDLVNSEYSRTKGRMCRDQYIYPSGRPRWGMQVAAVTAANSSTGSLTTAVNTSNSFISRGIYSTVDGLGTGSASYTAPWAPVLELDL